MSGSNANYNTIVAACVAGVVAGAGATMALHNFQSKETTPAPPEAGTRPTDNDDSKETHVDKNQLTMDWDKNIRGGNRIDCAQQKVTALRRLKLAKNISTKPDSCKVYMIVLTGGPCAGKSTAIPRIRSFLEHRDFLVYVIPESATDLKSNGIHWRPDGAIAFQDAVVRLQLAREATYRAHAQHAAHTVGKPVVILTDRGVMSGRAYNAEEDFIGCLERSQVGFERTDDWEAKVFSQYDAVFHLVTAADGAACHYKNTSYRFENPQEAVELDKKLQKAWLGHPCQTVFRNEDGKTFEDKMGSMVSVLCDILNLPNTNRKPLRYLLKGVPSQEDVAEGGGDIVEAEFEKIYLRDSPETLGDDNRVYEFIRRRSMVSGPGADSFCHKLVREELGQKIEIKRQISCKRQYQNYQKYKDPTRHVVRQRRKYFLQKDTFFEVVQYLNPDNVPPLLNIYVADANIAEKDIPIPDWIRPFFDGEPRNVIKDFRYSSHYLSLANRELLTPRLSGMNKDAPVPGMVLPPAVKPETKTVE